MSRVVDGTEPPAPLWKRGTQYSSEVPATVRPKSQRDPRNQASDQCVRLHQALPPTVVVQDVALDAGHLDPSHARGSNGPGLNPRGGPLPHSNGGNHFRFTSVKPSDLTA